MKLHESIATTCKEVVIKENPAFRVRMIKHEVLSPRGLYSIDMIQEDLKQDGTVNQANTYNFFMTKDELQKLAHSLTL